MATKNYYVGPQDGWLQVITAGAAFSVRISGFPHTHPFYVYGDPSGTPTLVGTVATGTVVFSTGVPTAGQVVTIGTETYTFRAAAALPFEVTIGASNTATATNFAAVVNTDSQLVTATVSTGTVTVTSKLSGARSNYTMTDNASNVAVGGAVMTGGTEPTLGVLVCHDPFQVENSTADGNEDAFYIRVVSPHAGSKYQDGRVRIDVYTDGGTLI